MMKYDLRAMAVAEGATEEEARHAATKEDAKAELVTLILETRRKKAEECRKALRKALITAVGGAMEAFRMIDLSGSGKISLQELTDGFEFIGIDWQGITGFRRILDVFTIFDRNRDGHIDYEEMFPPDQEEQRPPTRLSTPEYWEHWCKSSEAAEYGDRGPRWDSGTPSMKLRRLFKDKKKMKEVSHDRLTMSLLFRTLKSRGKSDAQCRECIALHLPRGTGPKDRQSVQMFSELDVKNVRKTYEETFKNSLKTIEKEVYEMRDQRLALSEAKQRLYAITGPKLQAMRLEKEEKKTAVASSFKGFHLISSGPSPAEEMVEESFSEDESDLPSSFYDTDPE
jgi:hypothetical protein